MDRYQLARLFASSAPVEREAFVLERCAGKTVLDLGCVKHSAEFAANDPNWLHGRIRKAAKKAVGVDYAQAEIEKLKKLGVEVAYGDVTKPLALDEKFDLIFAGDLIEHLTNWDGFFENLSRLLAPGGRVILTTPNPFYRELVDYAALKRRVIVNPEHTCWIDPQTMNQLVSRFGFAIEEGRFIRRSFKLGDLITEGAGDPYDIFTERWDRETTGDKLRRKLFGAAFALFYLPFKCLTGGCSPMVASSDYLVVLKKGQCGAKGCPTRADTLPG